jgi:hypothetical protein
MKNNETNLYPILNEIIENWIECNSEEIQNIRVMDETVTNNDAGYDDYYDASYNLFESYFKYVGLNAIVNLHTDKYDEIKDDFISIVIGENE